MLCQTCKKNEATVHLTTIVGTEQETTDLCKDCAPSITGLPSFEPKDLQALPAIGKRCQVCGKEALPADIIAAGNVTYRCSDCDLELGRILRDLIAADRPELMQPPKDAASFLAFASVPEIKAWMASAHERAVRILKDRRKQHGGDKGS